LATGPYIQPFQATYAQGAVAELVAMATIGVSDHFGMPVSTTHVLSSGVAGNHGGKSFGSADQDSAQFALGLGADLPGVRGVGGNDLCFGSLLRPERFWTSVAV
jgi:PiT family inorganic phosphate transporter